MDTVADEEAKKALVDDPNDPNRIKSEGLKFVFT